MLNLFRKSPVGAQFPSAVEFEMTRNPLTSQDAQVVAQEALAAYPEAKFPRTATQQFLSSGHRAYRGLVSSTLVGYGLTGTSRQLKIAAKALLAAPADAKLCAAFADALYKRCEKENAFVELRSVQPAVLAEAVQSTLATYASKAQQDSLQDIQKLVLKSFAQNLIPNAVKFILEGNDVASIESEIKAKSARLAQLSGESAESFEKAIRAGMLQALDKDLQKVVTVTPEMVKSRIAAETATYTELVNKCEHFDADYMQFLVRYNQQLPKAEAAVETAEQARAESGMQLRGHLAALRNVLATLIERAAVVGVDATSQKEVLYSLTALLDAHVDDALAHQTVRQIAQQLPALSAFLDHKDTKKLSAEKKPVVAALKVVQGSIDSFFKADLALFTASSALRALETESSQFEKTQGELIEKKDAQAALVKAQANLDIETENMKVYESEVVAYNKQFGWFGRGLAAPVLPETAEVREGIETLVQAEVAAANALNKAVLKYLMPDVVAQAQHGFFGRVLEAFAPVKF